MFHILEHKPAGFYTTLIAMCQSKDKHANDRCHTDVCLFFSPRQQLILTNDTTAKCGSYQHQAMSCHVQSHKTPCALCHSSLHRSAYYIQRKYLTTGKHNQSVLGTKKKKEKGLKVILKTEKRRRKKNIKKDYYICLIILIMALSLTEFLFVFQ